MALWTCLANLGIMSGDSTYLGERHTDAGTESLYITKQTHAPWYIVTYRTYAPHNEGETRRVTILWRVFFAFDPKTIFAAHASTFSNETMPDFGFLAELRMRSTTWKIRIKDFVLPRYVTRATEDDLTMVERDVHKYTHAIR